MSYAEEPCWYCGDNDGFVKYHDSPTAKESVPLCNTCLKKYGERDGYAGYFKVERCPTCHKHTHTLWRLYKKGDKSSYGGITEVMQCKNCDAWFSDLWQGYCDECFHKPKVQETIEFETMPIDCPVCDTTVVPKRRDGITGKVFKVLECWKCGWTEEEQIGKRNVWEPPKGVRTFESFQTVAPTPTTR
jgi:hypothetical protein